MEMFSVYPTTMFNGQEIKNITARIDIIQRAKDAVGIYEYSIIKEGQRPEDLAYKMYGDPQLYWIILMINDMTDPFYDWPLSSNRLNEFVLEKYGTGNANAVHHYETARGDWTNSDTVGAIAVSNTDYENALNEAKRRIKLVKKDFIPAIIAQYEVAFK